MSNQLHIDRLKQGVKRWNSWRQQEAVIPDLSGADLQNAALARADLSATDLRGASLRNADLRGANLVGSFLQNADLRGADLSSKHLKERDSQRLARLKMLGEIAFRKDRHVLEQLKRLQHLGPKASIAYLTKRLRAHGFATNGRHLRRINLDYLGGANLTWADLSQANLSKADLERARLDYADLRMADLREANLKNAALFKADLSAANLGRASLERADFRNAILTEAKLYRAQLSGADLSFAVMAVVDLRNAQAAGADFGGAFLADSNLSNSDLAGADLSECNLCQSNLSRADLECATLEGAIANGTNFAHANLAGCRVYGLSAWNIELRGAAQTDLVITPSREPTITLDNLEVAQFTYLLLNNSKLRGVIDSITAKMVLVLGRFTPTRKRTLDAVRDSLRNRNYLPVIFDFDRPSSRDFTETVSTLAHLARFVIADLTDPRSVPQELTAIVPHLPSVPVQPLLRGPEGAWAMFSDLARRSNVNPPFHYTSDRMLMDSLLAKVIKPAEKKARELMLRR